MADITTLKNRLTNKGFMVKEQEGGFLLVHPSRGKYDWEADELGFRSVVLDETGRVVSSGWPKFFNQGEWPEHDARIAEELESGRAVITHKHDGSLIIRSVLPDGRILFRTRDTFDGGKFAPLAEAVARAKYPCLLDPTFATDESLLFEYVGSGNQIVVRYEGEDDLILLGVVSHAHSDDGVRYARYDAFTEWATANGLRAVETYDWAENGIAGVLGLVQDWDKAEGVVVRSSDGQTLLKIKSAWYFAQHALRWNMTYESICRFALDGGIEDEEHLARALALAGWDYETTLTARDHFRAFAIARLEAAALKADALAFVAAFEQETGGTFEDERARRKAFATRSFGAGEGDRARAGYRFLVYDGKMDKLDATLLRNIVLNRGKRK